MIREMSDLLDSIITLDFYSKEEKILLGDFLGTFTSGSNDYHEKLVEHFVHASHQDGATRSYSIFDIRFFEY
jgi:hypothetical protein